MKQKMIISNIRVTESDWRQVKAAAGDLGMSVNRYINHAIEGFTAMKELSEAPKEVKRKKSSIWDLPEMTKQIKIKSLGLSKEDEEIYAV